MKGNNPKKLRSILLEMLDSWYGKIGTKKRDAIEHKTSVNILLRDTPIREN